MPAFEETILSFFETIPEYYGCQTEVSITLCDDPSQTELHDATWMIATFELARAAYRHRGDRLMMEGPGFYFELSASRLCHFHQKGRHKFEFIEDYGNGLFRLTKIRFESIY
ncbi:MAG: hypothetical protein CFE24_05195 [Flavobacterium sp. BFFFF2]|nr:MAG: hypothetical protein CFE24_05195 [Flavobacterium sp. BFFFF2]